MMSSPEVEKFEVTEEDLYNEFNINRPQFRPSKHKATYGIWADEDSDDEGRQNFGSKRGGKASRDYTAPLSFVSGGVKVGDKVTKEEADEGEDSSDSEGAVDKTMMAPKFGKPMRRGPTAYKARKAGQDDLGEWEKHTKGFGAKMLERMGHVSGKGLGRASQGITAPVEAFQRKGKGALGFYGTERTNRSLTDFPKKKDEDEEEAEKFQQQMQQWKKSGEGEKKRKPKYVYKTAEDIIASGPSSVNRKKIQDANLPKVKVIDMTGKEQRVLSGYHALAHKHDKPIEDIEYSQTQEKKQFDLPELLHNLDLLVDMSEEEIINNDRKIKTEGDMEVNLKYEQEKMTVLCDQEEKHINRLAEIVEMIESCERRSLPGCDDPLTLDDCSTMFKRIQDDFYEEYQLYELSTLAVALVYPLIKGEFETWDPLTNPGQGVGTARKWRDLLSGMRQPYQQGHGPDGYMDPYDRIMWEVWMPHVRTAISKWNVRHPDPVIEILEAWLPILPEWIFQNILEQLVLPRLQKEVEAWNPLTDTMPIHAWLHPWLPLMGPRLEPLYAPIRHKLSSALVNWHPSDSSAKMILEPWKPVFQPAHMDAFLIKNIVPKLDLCMSEFIINPLQQQLGAWNWVMSWYNFLPTPCIVTILQKHFFPKWTQVLCTWLNSNPNYDEVTKWYTGWKSLIPEDLVKEPVVKDAFVKVLDVMNRAVTGHYQPGARENVAYLTSTERRREFDTPPPLPYTQPTEPVRAVAAATSSVPTSFRELIERKAQDYNIEFVPIPNRTYEAKQVYRFGRMNIYIDRSVIFMHENNVWVPVSLNTLVDRA